MGRKYFLLPTLAGAAWLFAGHAGWALTAYVTGMSEEDAYAIDPATIQDVASGHRTADVYDVQIGYEVNIGKMEFDCAGRRVQTLSEKIYEAEETGLNFKSDLGAVAPGDVPQGSMLDALFTFVCGWPQVSSTAVKVEPDVPDLPRLVIYLSNAVMKSADESEPETK